MSETARDRILARLRAPPAGGTEPDVPAPAAAAPDAPHGRPAEVVDETVRAEVTCCRRRMDRPAEGGARARRSRPCSMRPAPTSLRRGGGLAAGCAGLPELVAYAEPVESFKERLFGVEAASRPRPAPWRTRRADPAATGAEPRLMSLVPPVHIAVLRADTVTLARDAMREGRWAEACPPT